MPKLHGFRKRDVLSGLHRQCGALVVPRHVRWGVVRTVTLSTSRVASRRCWACLPSTPARCWRSFRAPPAYVYIQIKVYRLPPRTARLCIYSNESIQTRSAHRPLIYIYSNKSIQTRSAHRPICAAAGKLYLGLIFHA